MPYNTSHHSSILTYIHGVVMEAAIQGAPAYQEITIHTNIHTMIEWGAVSFPRTHRL